MDLFSKDLDKNMPLAARMRPKRLDEVLGQDHLTGDQGMFQKMIQSRQLHSFVLWGPPGSGKTTIAQIVADECRYSFVPFSAVLSGIKEVRTVMVEAKSNKNITQQKTIVFVDEIHRFNKAQQDAFLPYVEQGDIVLIGATTENPSFEINSALLSRLRVYVVNALNIKHILHVLQHAIDHDVYLKSLHLPIESDGLQAIAQIASGDARCALNILEACVTLASNEKAVTIKHVEQAYQKALLLYDKNGEEHYNTISALHKSMRNGDPDAALYWLGRMLESGEDPLYIARRLIRFASEDIGNADPQALSLAIAAKDAVHFVGLPEGKLALAQAVTYMATAPKSNAVYVAYQRVESDLKQGHVYAVPKVIRNAPTELMRNLDYGKGYDYAHDHKEQTTDIQCLPDELVGTKYYHPKETGFEREIIKRIRYFENIRKRNQGRTP